MLPADSVATLAVVCKRDGPGRLPRADRPSIGAGYAGATAALAVAVMVALWMSVFHVLVGPFLFGHVAWAVAALAALPLVIPAAFVSGTVVWRVLPNSVPWFGAVAGLLATLGTYVVSLAVVFLLIVGAQVIGGLGSGAEPVLFDALLITAVVGAYAVITTGWLVFPIGCLSGAIYERARGVSVDR